MNAMPRNSRTFLTAALAVLAAGALPLPVAAQTIYASGQFLTASGTRENRIYAVNPATGAATPTSPLLPNDPPGLAGTPDGRLLGYSGGQLGQLDPGRGAFSPIGPPSNINSTGFDITADGRGFLVGLSGVPQLYGVNIMTGAASAVGAPGALGAGIDAAFGLTPGTSKPFIIGLGSVGGTLYGVDLETGMTNLVAIDPTTGAARPIGARNALGDFGGGRYSGFSALTGVDTTGSGRFDALYGSVNFDALSPNPQNRIGGVARFDLTTGTFSLAGANPGLIFFGFGSSPAAPVPEASTLVSFGLLGLGLIALARRGARRRTGGAA